MEDLGDHVARDPGPTVSEPSRGGETFWRRSGLVLWVLLFGLVLGNRLAADNGAFAFSYPLEGITLDGDLGDWPSEVARHPVRNAHYGDYPSGPDDAYLYFRTGYDVEENLLYVAFEAVDDHPTGRDDSEPGPGAVVALFLDLWPIRLVDEGLREDLNFWLVFKGQEAEWMELVGESKPLTETIVRYAKEVRGRRLTLEMVVSIDGLTGGRARLAAGKSIGLDVGMNDEDADQTSTYYAWGRGHGKYEIQSYGDLMLAGTEHPLVNWDGFVVGPSPGGLLFRNFFFIRSLQFPDWPAMLIECDDEDHFDLHLPQGDYALVSESDREAPVQLTNRKLSEMEPIRLGEMAAERIEPEVFELSGAETEWSSQGQWSAMDVAALFPGFDSQQCLEVDSENRVWVGGTGGLVRFDGVSYRFFKLVDGERLVSIERLQRDGNGGLWAISERGGLFRVDLASDQFRHYANRIYSSYFCATSDSLGRLYLGGLKGILRYEGGRFQVSDASWNHALSDVREIGVTSHGSLWCLGPNYKVQRYADGTVSPIPGWERRKGSSRHYGAIDVSRDDHVFVAGSRGEVLEYVDHPGSTPVLVPGEVVLSGDEEYWAMAHHPAGGFVAVGEAVTRIAASGTERIGRPLGLLMRLFDDVVCDAAGTIWVTWSWEGVARYGNSSVQQVGPSVDVGRISCGGVDEAGRFWFGTKVYGALERGAGQSVHHRREDPDGWLPSNDISTLLPSKDGGVWVGTAAGVGRRYADGSGRRWIGLDDAPVGLVSCLLELKEGELWVGTNGGVYRYANEGWTHWTRESSGGGLASDQINHLWQNPDGSLSAFGVEGVSVWNGDAWERSSISTQDIFGGNPRVSDWSRDGSGIWVGTERNGLFWCPVDRSRAGIEGVDFDRARHYTRAEGLSDMGVSALLSDAQGRVWVGTRRGLDRVEGMGILNLGTQDGIPAGGICGISDVGDGSVLVTSGAGAVWYHPKHGNPKVSARIRRGASENSREDGRGFSSDREIVIDLAGYSPTTRGSQMRFVYQLDEQPAQWMLAGDVSLSLSRLPAGAHRVEISAVDRDFNRSLEPAVIEFDVYEPASVIARQVGIVFLCLVTLGALVLAIRGLRQRDQARSDLIEQTVRHNQDLLRAKDTAEKARALAEEASQAKSEFLANISHEIRTPLNAIVGFSRIIGESKVSDGDRQRMVATIDGSSKHLLSLINDVLDLSKIESGRVELELDYFDLRTLVDDIGSMFSDRCERAGLEWRHKIRIEGRTYVRADLRRIRQILINLLGNAVKFTDSGFVALTVSETEIAPPKHAPATPNTQWLGVRFEVSDSGRGISAHEQRKIFGMFQQGSLGREKGGSGLGLVIVRGLAELMRGRVSVLSTVGKGSVFRFEVPLERTEKIPVTAVEKRLPVSMGSLKTLRALVVDDVAANRLLLNILLQKMGATVSEAASGPEAIQAVHGGAPDIVFMDLRMPGMTGYEVLEKLKQQSENLGQELAPIVAVTASALNHERESCLEYGFDGFLSKPVELEGLMSVIQELLPTDQELIHDPRKPGPKLAEAFASVSLSQEELEELQKYVGQYRRTELRERILAIRERGGEFQVFAEACLDLIAAGDWAGLRQRLDECLAATKETGSVG